MAKRGKKNGNENRNKKRILGVLLILLSVLLFISLVTHTAWDDSRIQAHDNPFRINFDNQVGIIGALSAYVLYFFFGWLSVFIPLILAMVAFRILDFGWRRGIILPFWAACSICILMTMLSNVYLIDNSGYLINYIGTHGGYLFHYLTLFLMKIMGPTGSYLILGAAIIIWIIVLGFTYNILGSILKKPIRFDYTPVRNVLAGIMGLITLPFRRIMERRRRLPEENIEAEYEVNRPEAVSDDSRIVSNATAEDRQAGSDSGTTRKKVTLHRKPKEKSAAEVGQATEDFVFPGLELLDDNPESGTAVSHDELSFTARALKDTLETFDVRIDGNIDYFPGPIITRYEFKPAAGVKVNRIMNLSDDLALALKAKRIRIVAPIPGKAAVGVEIPNRRPRLVYLKDIISSEAYSDNRLRLPLALGKSISGKPFVTDLARMPHLLIAGATGSGKSVCINGIITSLIYRLHPRELKLIFIDPKMLELSVYKGIPHLGRPVVTNSKRAEKVLADAVVEMEKRYKMLAGMAVRNIDDYNARQKNIEDKMPYIVIVVDELADMMMAASSSRIETLITRLAQMARAVGIHLILATQRPSVDVITGLIKANFSARIGFQVATKIDSRTILDCNGAEKLLGNGDMLFLQPGQPEPVRIHGAFISSKETEGLVKFILDQVPDEEKEEAEKEKEEESPADEVDLDDPLFIEAAETVIRHKQGSVSLLQRKLGIGYQRAARLIDRLEDAKIVSPYDGSKAREVLVDRSYLEELLASRSLTGRNR
jgi:S-DNA-T family DNA segregation ATPase FtsK/SpoIIIE